MSEIIKNRTEILFLYDIENANPNGDPLDENKPRFDQENSTVLVSDVRLKRNIRDYFIAYKGYDGSNGKDVFVKRTTMDNLNAKETSISEENSKTAKIKDAKSRAKDFDSDAKKILNECIDIRIFGGVIPLDKDSITFTGPVQFQMGRSLNKTEIVTEQGTSSFSSTGSQSMTTFRTDYKIPYAIIGFNGIINENAAKSTLMSEDDKKLLYEAIWEGTKNLITRSKFGHNPLLLLFINYKIPFYIGNLRQKIKILSDKKDFEIRNINEYSLDFTEIFNNLLLNEDKIESIDIKINPALNIIFNNKKVLFNNNTIDLNELKNYNI